MAVSNKPWSEVNKTVESYGSVGALCAASLIDENEDGSKKQELCKLPVYEPGGQLNANALSSAAGYLNDTEASAESKAKARRKLLSLYKQADMDPPDSLKQTSYQLPASDLSAVELGGSLMRKQILPLRSISYNGGELSFDREKIDKIAENFKRRPFEFVPFVVSGTHSDDPTATGGEVVGMEATDSGLDALISLNDAGKQAVQRNDNRLPVSVRFMEDYSRESDGTHFGPVVAHVASTFSPRMHGMSGWQPVDASEDDEVVDLTGESYEEDASPDSGLSDEEQAVVEEVEREVADESNDEADNGDSEQPDDSEEEEDMADMPKEGDSVQFKRGGATHEGTFKRMEGEGDSQVAIVDVDGDEVKVPVSMLNKGSNKGDSKGSDGEPKDNSERSSGVDLAELEARDRRIAELESQNRNNTLELRRQKVERELEEYGRAGVPAADLDAARPLLMDDDSGVELSYTDLSEDGAAEKKSARGDLVRKMLDSRKGTVEFGEKGDASAQLSEDDAKDKKIREYAKEHEMSYGEAARYVS